MEEKVKNTKKVSFSREVLERCQKWPECYRVRYPDDPDVYCTCWDYSPEI